MTVPALLHHLITEALCICPSYRMGCMTGFTGWQRLICLYISRKMNTGSKGEERQWNNTESNNRGIVKLTDIYSEGEYAEIDCRTLAFKIYKKESIAKESSRSFCKNDKGKWKAAEE